MSETVVLLFALRREWSIFRSRLHRIARIPSAPCRAFRAQLSRTPLLILETGVGSDRTCAALHWIVRTIEPALVVSCGYSGALQATLRVGDVVIASEIADLRKPPQKHSVSLPWPIDVADFHGPIVCAETMVSDPEMKRQLGMRHDALAVDMESAAAAQACIETGTPFASVRVISDALGTRLSPRLATLLSGGQTPLWRILAALVRSPGLLPEMLRLARDTQLASQRLACTLENFLHRRAFCQSP